jgi:hypothetical protein
MDKLKWCCGKKDGIEIIEEKPHLSEGYMNEAQKDLNEIPKANDKWKTIISYYACYEALYSLAMKCGIKCEIHDCTIELMKLFQFEESEIAFIKNLKEEREGSQYYLKREKINKYEDVKRFILRCKEISLTLSSKRREDIRKHINLMQKGEK